MKQQKIVVICMDEEYISSIEYKLTEAFGQKAEFEYISNYQYFKKYMQEPQDIDILLIQMELYQEIIDKQNCPNIYLLTEDEEVVKRGGAQENCRIIYQYASIRSMIDSLDSSILRAEEGKTQASTKLVSVFSVNGGSGKTTTALGLSGALARDGFKVLYLNTECLQDYQLFIQNMEYLPDSIGYQCVMDCERAAEMMLSKVRRNGFEYIPPFSKALASYQITIQSVVRIMEYIQKKNIYDYIVMELSQEMQPEKMNLLQKSDRIVIVTTQEEQAVAKLGLFFNGITEWRGQCFLICNHYKKERKDYLTNSGISLKYSICEYIEEQTEPITLKSLALTNLYDKTAVAVR